MLYNKLKKNNRIPLHMPGHKRNIKLLGKKYPYDIDITEIDGFDNLHNPTGVIKDIEHKISKLYASDASFILVNGTTCGILAAISTVVKQGDNILVARNCHKSVYNAIELNKANAIYLCPEYDKYGIAQNINPEDVLNAIESNSIKLVVITSPTYEGVISDVDSICKIAHSKNIPVIVDSAHGAHYFERSSADITVMSLHKTLPALTQCAVAHINGNLVDKDLFRVKLSVFETSSPSYLLMSSVESSIDFVNNNLNLFASYYKNLDSFYNKTADLKHLKAFHYHDKGKIIVYSGDSNITGVELAEILRSEYNIEVEMALNNYILAIITICDDAGNLNAFTKSLLTIDSTLKFNDDSDQHNFCLPQKLYESYEVEKTNNVFQLNEALNKVSCEYVWAYPPGVPLLIPGEVVSQDILNNFNILLNNNVQIHSTYGNMPNKLMCKSI